MTAKISASADGLSGSLAVGATNAANFTATGGIPFMRNVLINGNLAINQRNVTIAAAANGSYGPDRWKKVDASNMTQIVEAGNFRPSAQYVLSGTGVTTQVLTSPASGNWTIPNIPITATNVQLEEGSIATPFEQRPIGLELSLCQRYYYQFPSDQTYPRFSGYSAVATIYTNLPLPVTMRIAPQVTTLVSGGWGLTNCTVPVIGAMSSAGLVVNIPVTVAGVYDAYAGSGNVPFKCSAEL